MHDSISPGAREFHTTRWSLVLAVRQGMEATAAREAMTALCRDYWYPLYAFVRRRGHAPHEAEDLTQGFFSTLLEGQRVAADPAHGRFRSYLLGALKHYLANEWDRANARKRGGGQRMIEWDGLDAEARYALEPMDEGNAEALYDRRWAMELLDRAMGRLRREFSTRGESKTFETLKGTLTGADIPRDEGAAQLGMTEGALKVAVHRLRKRYRELIRSEIAETTETADEVDEEMRYLVTVLRQGT